MDPFDWQLDGWRVVHKRGQWRWQIRNWLIFHWRDECVCKQARKGENGVGLSIPVCVPEHSTREFPFARWLLPSRLQCSNVNCECFVVSNFAKSQHLWGVCACVRAPYIRENFSRPVFFGRIAESGVSMSSTAWQKTKVEAAGCYPELQADC